MLSVLNIASFTLVLGAIGQMLLLKGPSSHDWRRILFVLFLVPWLTVYAISFCGQAFLGPRAFRHCLSFAMCWYAVITLLVESRHWLLRVEPNKHVQVIAAQALVGLGLIGFVVFIRAWLNLRRYETSLVNASRPQG
jgi:hypothetical protein